MIFIFQGCIFYRILMKKKMKNAIKGGGNNISGKYTPLLFCEDVSTISFNPATTTNLVKMLTRLVTEETKNKDRSLKVNFRSFLNESQHYSLTLELHHFLLNVFRLPLWHHQQLVLHYYRSRFGMKKQPPKKHPHKNIKTHWAGF